MSCTHTTVLIPDDFSAPAEFSKLSFSFFLGGLLRCLKTGRADPLPGSSAASGRAELLSFFLTLTLAAADVLLLLLSGVLSGAVFGLSLSPTLQSTISYLGL